MLYLHVLKKESQNSLIGRLHNGTFSDMSCLRKFPRWDQSREGRSRTLNHIRKKLLYTEEILNYLNTIPQTVEMTRLYGVDFDSVVEE